jgi:hypothetical protein
VEGIWYLRKIAIGSAQTLLRKKKSLKGLRSAGKRIIRTGWELGAKGLKGGGKRIMRRSLWAKKGKKEGPKRDGNIKNKEVIK